MPHTPTWARPDGRLGAESRAPLPRARGAVVRARGVLRTSGWPDHGRCPPRAADIAGRALGILVRGVRAAPRRPRRERARGDRQLRDGGGRLRPRGLPPPSRHEGDGIVALAWGSRRTLSLRLAIPVAALVRKTGAHRRRRTGSTSCLACGGCWRVPPSALALQGCYLLALRRFAREARRRQRHELLVHVSRGIDARRSDRLLPRAPSVAADPPSDPEGGDPSTWHAGARWPPPGWRRAGPRRLGRPADRPVRARRHYSGAVGRETSPSRPLSLTMDEVAWSAAAGACSSLGLAGFGLCVPHSGSACARLARRRRVAIGLATLVVMLSLMAAVSTRALAIAALGLARLAFAIGVASARWPSAGSRSRSRRYRPRSSAVSCMERSSTPRARSSNALATYQEAALSANRALDMSLRT